MSINTMYYSEDVKKIEKIEFSIYTNNLVKINSVVSNDPFGIDIPESYENYEAKKGGLVDSRLGTCDPFTQCLTCGLNHHDCPGHFGHTELAEPVFNYGFLEHIKYVLQCVCLKCSKILLEDKTYNTLKKVVTSKRPEILFREVKAYTKNVSFCFSCGVPVPKIKKDVNKIGSIRILIEYEVNQTGENSELQQDIQQAKKVKESLSPRDCYNILRNISDTDCYLLGFNVKIQRPEDLIIKNFPISPVIIRPTAKFDFMSSANMEHGLTHKLSDIIRKNKQLRQQQEKETIFNELSTFNQDVYILLQYHIATYFNNESLSLPRTEFKTNHRPVKSISESIKSKQGRIRSNLMGKRVDYSARSVITSDPYINIDQVGVPKRIATELTIPEEVTPFNIKYLTGLVKNGRDVYPGANFVLKINYRDSKAEVQKIDLRYRKKAIRLKYGDIVERHSIDGDYVLFNRQPTLHKPSMMGHKIQVIDNDELNTFRMNVSVCKPYNADYDGDEMNIHLAQSIQTRNELKRIANVQYQIVGAKNSAPIIGCQQDTLSGAYMLTDKSVKLKGYEVANILCNTSSDTKFEIEMDKEYSGHEVFSHIIPEGINNTVYKDNGNKKLEIVNGKLLIGYLDKKTLSTERNSIIHFIWNKYGPNKTRRFIDDSQKLILNYLMLRGQTASFKDLLTDNDMVEKIRQMVNNKLLESKYTITQYENDVDQLSLETIENSLQSEMGNVRAEIGSILSTHLDINNFIWVSATSGAKGNSDNVCQMVEGVVGQMTLESSRIKKNVENRSLIYFNKDDDTPEARGFIKSSFLSGLSGPESFYNIISAREGLIDTAIKTAQTGYIQRQLIKGLEDLCIKYDGTNRNTKGIVIQTVYGENGINQANQTELKFNIIEMDNKTLEEKLCFSKEQIVKLSKGLKMAEKELSDFNKKHYKKLKDLRDELRIIQRNALITYKTYNDSFVSPINMFRITQDYSNKKEHIELEPQEILDGIEKFITDYDNRLITFMKPTDKYIKNDDRCLKLLMEIALNEYLSPVKCIFTYGLTKKDFNKMMDEIKLNYIQAIIEPGEMVGIVAAQSIGEPTSQMNLNSKHTAGAKKSSTNSGVSRITELLRYSKNIKTPQMVIYFQDDYKEKNKVNKIVSHFKYLSIRELISSAEVYYDLGGNDELSKVLKSDNVGSPFFVNNQKVEVSSLPFVFRIVMNIEKMMNKETTLLDIKTKFISYWYKNYNNLKTLTKTEKDVISKISRCAILSNNVSDKEQIIHIRFSMSSFNYNIITDFLNMVFDDITLKGISGIKNTDIEYEPLIEFDKETGAIKNSKEYVAYTSGINFKSLRMIKGIDFTRTKCNDINTILKMYGIEAARQMLVHELSTTFNTGGGVTVNYNHLSLLVDQMCHLGEIISIDRHGLSKIDIDPIARASFEKTMDHFVNAALFNEKDNMKSISSRIALGAVIQGGTGAFELLLDIKKLEESEYTEDETNGRITFTPLEEELLLQDIMTNKLGKSDFFMP